MSLNSELEDARMFINWLIGLWQDYWIWLTTTRMGKFVTALFVFALVFAVFYRLRHIRR